MGYIYGINVSPDANRSEGAPGAVGLLADVHVCRPVPVFSAESEIGINIITCRVRVLIHVGFLTTFGGDEIRVDKTIYTIEGANTYNQGFYRYGKGMNIHHIYLRHSIIVSKTSVIPLTWRGLSYELVFDAADSAENKSLKLRAGRGFETGQPQLLTCLSIYFGENFLRSEQISGYRLYSLRGRLFLDDEHLRHFLQRAEKVPFKSHPLWRNELLDLALSYYVSALTCGLNLMPVTLGLFGVSIEALINAYNGKRNDYKTLGKKPYQQLIEARLGRYKGTCHETWAKEFQQRVENDLELLTAVRNYTYGHSLIHTAKSRERLSKQLQGWYQRNGLSSEFSKASFPKRKLRIGLSTGRALGLYKVGLFLNRLLIFWYLGHVMSIPFAEKDLRIA